MPRDDLSIDFVSGRNFIMPALDFPDAASVIEEFTYRASNLPAEFRFMQDELDHKERQIQACLDVINSRDNAIQKWIKLNTSLVKNPKEEHLRKAVMENYDKVQILQEEKIAICAKYQRVLDRHVRFLDDSIKSLQDRGEYPKDEDRGTLESLVADLSSRRASISGPSLPSAQPQGSTNIPARQSIQQTNIQRSYTQMQQATPNTAASSPVTPGGATAAALLLQRQQRESSAGATNKRQRINGSLNNAPTNSSGLARHSSLGPGTPKAGTPSSVRAGSAGPRAPQKGSAASKKLAPHKQNGLSRKGKPGKSGLSRVKQSRNKNSPSLTNDSELSDADSGSAEEEDEALTPKDVGRDADGDEEMVDAEDDDAGDDRKYCTCQNVSYGDMVACDNENCPYEWFHWSCVGLKSEPEGQWICPPCTLQLNISRKK